jgi:hypothetical protein
VIQVALPLYKHWVLKIMTQYYIIHTNNFIQCSAESELSKFSTVYNTEGKKIIYMMIMFEV